MLNLGTYYGNGYSTTVGSSSSAYGGAYRTNVNPYQVNRYEQMIASCYGTSLTNISNKMKAGEVDSAIREYEKLLETISSENTGLNNYQLATIVDGAHELATGLSLSNTVIKETSGSFMTGIKESIPVFGLLADGNSESEAIAKLSGDKASFKSQVVEGLGSLTGAAGFGAAAGIAFGIAGGAFAWPVAIGVGVTSLATSVIKHFMSK